MHLIELKDLTKTYEDGEVVTPVLKGVTFTIEAGEFVAVMGPSGSGKSTLLHILGFLDEPSGGEYTFDGKLASSYSADEVARLRNQDIGFVFQAFNLLARTTVLENVKLPLLYSRVPSREWEERARAAIAAVGLQHRTTYVPSALSGGERQRVAIARALVLSPKVIFADEPTGNLDSVSGRAVMEIIERLNKEGGHTVILITHETETAEHAERIIHIRDGQVESDDHVTQRLEAEAFRK